MRTTCVVLMLLVVGCAAPVEPPAEAVGDGAAELPEITASHQMRTLQVGDLSMRVAEQGNGPLVLLLHGFPESWYSWRHQLPALAAAGFKAVAPDMRGYGSTDAPPAIEDYAMDRLCADVTGLIDTYGEEQAVVVGHDWGALVAWQCTLLAKERVRGVAALSVPYSGRGEIPPTEGWKQANGDEFFYILYFQEPGVAEAELDADPRTVLRRVYASPNTARDESEVTDRLASAGGWSARMGHPTEWPPWLTEDDLDYYAGEFDGVSFRGGLNYYRNFDRNWEQLADVDPVIAPPALFIAGAQDGVIGSATKDQLVAGMSPLVPDLRGVHLIPDTGHWTQQERPDEVNRLLIDFLEGLP